jgi:hypothetical protein
MGKNHNPIQVGPLLVQRTLSSSVDFRAGHEQYWRSYLCPWNTPKAEIGTVGRLIEVTSAQQLRHERNTYRVDNDLAPGMQLAYYEVIDV